MEKTCQQRLYEDILELRSVLGRQVEVTAGLEAELAVEKRRNQNQKKLILELRCRLSTEKSLRGTVALRHMSVAHREEVRRTQIEALQQSIVKEKARIIADAQDIGNVVVIF